MDEFYMQQALYIAQFAEGRTSPNPLVGAVVVKDDRIIGQGWHRKAGTEHAEIHALRQAGDLARGSTLYVTLEPCNHHGRTGPCTQAIIDAGVRRVVVAMVDPNPLVAGKGLDRIRSAGIEVREGILAEKAAKQNEIFIKWISTGMPFGILKAAITLDGKIATSTGFSKWITGDEARFKVHQFRDRYDAIMVGIGTVLADNPQLTTRLPQGGKNPIRIILDSMARTPPTAHVVADKQAHTIIAVASNAPRNRIERLTSLGAEVLTVNSCPAGLDLKVLFRQLGQRQITSVLVEGGGAVHSSALAANVVDKIHWFIAPKIFGGVSAPGPVGGLGAQRVEDAVMLEELSTETLGEDILITAYVTGREGRDVYRTCGRVGQSENAG